MCSKHAYICISCAYASLHNLGKPKAFNDLEPLQRAAVPGEQYEPGKSFKGYRRIVPVSRVTALTPGELCNGWGRVTGVNRRLFSVEVAANSARACDVRTCRCDAMATTSVILV